MFEQDRSQCWWAVYHFLWHIFKSGSLIAKLTKEHIAVHPALKQSISNQHERRNTMYNKLRSNKGFTLIELLIVVAIIGILAAIAIPQFSKYRIQGFNASANSDMRNIRTSQESLYAEWQHYGKTGAAALPGAGGFGIGTVVTGPGVAATPNLITTFDSVNTARGLQIPVGNNISAASSTDALGTSFTLATKHLQGDTIFGGDSDSTANYKLTYNATGGLGKNTGVVLATGDEEVPLSGTDEFATAVAKGWKAM